MFKYLLILLILLSLLFFRSSTKEHFENNIVKKMVVYQIFFKDEKKIKEGYPNEKEQYVLNQLLQSGLKKHPTYEPVTYFKKKKRSHYFKDHDKVIKADLYLKEDIVIKLELYEIFDQEDKKIYETYPNAYQQNVLKALLDRGFIQHNTGYLSKFFSKKKETMYFTDIDKDRLFKVNLYYDFNDTEIKFNRSEKIKYI